MIALQTLELLIFKGEEFSFPQFLTIIVILHLMNKSSSGDMELSAKCFQDLVLKDHNHPAALINYAAELLCKHSSTVAGLFLIKEPLNCLLLSICLSKVHMKK